MGSIIYTESMNLQELNLHSHELRSRTVPKISKKKSKSTAVVPKSPKRKWDPLRVEYSTNTENFDDSQESISMLQDCYKEKSPESFPELMETCLDSELEIINTDDEGENMVIETCSKCSATKTENSTQTDSPVLQLGEENEIAKHTQFIGCVVKLKSILSSKKKISNKKLWSLLNESENFSENNDYMVPSETIDYIFRSSSAENVFRETIHVLLSYLEERLKRNSSNVSYFWKNSMYETAVGMLNQAVDSDVGIRKIVESFLNRIIKSVLNGEEKAKNLVLESKAMFIENFCQSTYLIYVAISNITEKLQILKTINKHSEYTSLEEKLNHVRITKSSYLLLRVLELLLESFKTKLDHEEFEVSLNEPKEKNVGVLEMWKKHWNTTKVEKKQETGPTWEITVSKWCEKLDETSVYCLNHIPILSMAVERCGELAKEILKLCHPRLVEKQKSGMVTGPGEEQEFETV